MRYQPCRIAKCYQVRMPADGTRITTKNFLAGKLIVSKPYYQAMSNRVVGHCGHKHRTEEAAEPCLAKIKKKWSEWRSESIRAAVAKRKAKAA